jgi:hypothetical protein
LSVDPDLTETGQPYAFTGDDPLNTTDPLGNIATNQFGAGCGAVIQDCVETTAQENSGNYYDAAPTGPYSSPYPAIPPSPAPAPPSSSGFSLSGLLNDIDTPIDDGLSDVTKAVNSVPVFNYIDNHPVQSIGTTAAVIYCASGVGTLSCVVAGITNVFATDASDEYHHCSQGDVGVDTIVGLTGAGLAGVSSIGEGALEDSPAFKTFFKIHQGAAGAAGAAVSAC